MSDAGNTRLIIIQTVLGSGLFAFYVHVHGVTYFKSRGWVTLSNLSPILLPLPAVEERNIYDACFGLCSPGVPVYRAACGVLDASVQSGQGHSQL